jgi:NADPH-dependent glutamate synthase beta subunit-like oxidoreductase
VKDFQGFVKHSSEFSIKNSTYTGKKVIVVGTGSSAHDIAHGAYNHGAEVKMVQRSHTYVISLESALKLLLKRYNEGKHNEDGDILNSAAPTALSKRQGSDLAAILAKQDSKILNGLTKAGFVLLPGPELPAVVQLTIHRAGGFYLDSGTSALIASGAIKIKQGQEVSHFTPTSVVFTDGAAIEADEVVFATGYANGRTRTRKVFGDEVADHIQPIWGFDEQGEIRGIWRRSGQEGFWVAAGSIWLSRYYSRLLVLQIKMVKRGWWSCNMEKEN